MAWIPGCPQDPGIYYGPLDPQAVVLHRTYGAWPGDYSVGKQGIFHILLGKADGAWCQFAPTDVVQYHCNGANFRAFGVEIEGTNDDPLTDWQAARLGDVLRYARDTHGIPIDSYVDPYSTPAASISVNHTGFSGVICHVSVQTDDGSLQHSDLITPQDYARALGPPAPAPTPPEEEIMGKCFRVADKPDVWYIAGTTRVPVPDQAALYGLALNGMIESDGNGPKVAVLAADHAAFLDMFPIAHA